MNPNLKNILRQITPPLLISSWKSYCEKNRRWSPQQLALKAAHERRNAACSANEIVFRDRIKLVVHPDSLIPLEYFCYVSIESVEEMDCFLEQTREKQRLLDVGALHGAFSLAFAAHHPSRQAVAVDASPIAFARLLYNLHKNEAPNITPVECALSAESGVLRMHYEWEHAVAGGTKEAGGLSVEKRTGDSLCERLAFSPDVIKIDVEGHEVKVLRGLRQTLQRCRPLLFLEVHPRWILREEDNLRDLVRELDQFGYTAMTVQGRRLGLREIAEFTEDQRLVLRPT